MKRTALKRKTPLRAKTGLKRGGRLRPRSLKGQRQQRKRPFEYMGWIKSLPCAVCGADGSEAAHTGPRGLGQKSSDWQCIPLCADHHRTGREALDRIGPRAFTEIHGIVIPDLVARLNNAWGLLTAA